MTTIKTIATLLALVGGVAVHAAPAVLIEADWQPASPTNAKAGRAAALLGSYSARFDPAQIQADTLTLTLRTPTGQSLVLDRRSSRLAESGLLEWSGQVRGSRSSRDRGVFVFGPTAAAGTVISGGREWRLQQQAGGYQLLELDASKLQSAGITDLIDATPVVRQPASAGHAAKANEKTSIVDVLVAVDARYQSNYDAAVAAAQQEIALANDAFGDSQTRVTLRLAGTHIVTDTPGASAVSQLDALVSSNDGVMDDVHAVRNAVGADIVVLLSQRAGAVCGVARSLLPTPDLAFAVVGANSQCDNTLFAHEVAHLFSADHDPANPSLDPSGNPISTKAYAHGFVRQYTGANAFESYATIMTYNGSTTCGSNPCLRMNAFSNPRRLDEYGYAMGTVSTYDNARAIAEEGARVAAFRTAPAQQNQAVLTGSWYNPARPGPGVNLSRASDGNLVAYWYTYTSAGTPTWYVSAPAAQVGGSWNSVLYRAQRAGNGSVTVTVVGDAMLRFSAGNRAVFYWDFHDNGNSAGFDGSEAIQHLFGGSGATGAWYAPTESGWGFSLDQSAASSVATVYYFESGQPVWVQSGVMSGTSIINLTGNLTRYSGTGMCPSCQGQPVVRTDTPAGSMLLTLIGNNGAGWFNIAYGGVPVWVRGTPSQPISLARLTYP